MSSSDEEDYDDHKRSSLSLANVDLPSPTSSAAMIAPPPIASNIEHLTRCPPELRFTLAHAHRFYIDDKLYKCTTYNQSSYPPPSHVHSSYHSLWMMLMMI
jgi:hypothetical protein